MKALGRSGLLVAVLTACADARPAIPQTVETAAPAAPPVVAGWAPLIDDATAGSGGIDRWLGGRWLAVGRTGLAWRLELDRGLLTVWRPGEAGEVATDLPIELTTLSADSNHRRVSVVGHGEQFTVDLVAASTDEVWAFSAGENGLVRLLRQVEVPPSICGVWDVAFADNFHLAAGVLTIDGDGLELRVGERVARTGAVFAASGATDSGGTLVSLANQDLGGLLRYVRLDEHTLVLQTANEDQYMILSRPGFRPPWLPARPAHRSPPSSEGSGSAAAVGR